MLCWYRFLVPSAWPISLKISIALLASSILPMSVSLYSSVRESLNRVESSEYKNLQLLAISNVNRLDQLITDYQRIAVQIAYHNDTIDFLSGRSGVLTDPLKIEVQSYLENIFRSSPDSYDAIFLLDRRGTCRASTDPKFIGQNYSFREYFKKAIEGKAYISGILIGATTGRPGLFLSYPVRSERGEIIGVSVLKIKGQKVWDIVDSLKVDSSTRAFLIDEYGILIGYPDHQFLFRSLAPLSPEIVNQIRADKRYGKLTEIESLGLTELASATIRARQPGNAKYTSSADGIDRIVGFAPLTKQPWVLGVSKSKQTFSLPLNEFLWQQARNIALIGSVTTVLALLLARSIARPIRVLTSAARDLPADHFNPEPLEEIATHPDDIGQLARVFLEMAEEVESRKQKLLREVEELRIEIDETKKSRQVAEVTETEYFQTLLGKARRLRSGDVEFQDGIARERERTPAIEPRNGHS